MLLQHHRVAGVGPPPLPQIILAGLNEVMTGCGVAAGSLLAKTGDGVATGDSVDVVIGASCSGRKNPTISCNDVKNFASAMTQVPTIIRKDVSL